jgi:hypothetical protein
MQQRAAYIARSACDERGTDSRQTDKAIFWPSLVAHSLAAGSSVMATVDVSRVVALTNKAVSLEGKGYWARAAEVYAEAAVTAAQTLHQPDCVIVARLQASNAEALFLHAQTAGVTEARQAELTRSALLELLPPAMASLERRLAAGTLLAGACRPHEVAWSAATTAHANELMASIMPNAAAVRVPPTAAVTSAWSAYVGYDAYMLTAGLALELCSLATDLSYAQTLNLPEATAVACSVFVASAFDMFQLRTVGTCMIEMTLVRNAQTFIEEKH